MFQFIRELNRIYDDENKDDMPVYKSFEFLDNSQELKGFKENEINNLKLINAKEEDGVVRNHGGTEGFMESEDPLHRAGFPKCPTNESQEDKGRKKIYVKRDVEDYDMPEMVAFFEDSNYHLFKHISRDNESAFQDDSLIEDYELDRYNLSSILNNDDVESYDSTEATLERLSCITNELQLVAEDVSKNEQHLCRRFWMEDDEDSEDEIDEIDDALFDCPAETIHLIKHARKNKQNSKKPIMEDTEDFNGRASVCTDNPAEKFLYSSYKRLTMADEEDFDGTDSVWIDNPTKRILHKIHPIKEIPSKESALSNSSSSSATEAEQNYCATSDACLKSEEKSTNSNTETAASKQAAALDCGQVLEAEKPESGMSSESPKTSSQSLINQYCDEDSSSDPPSGPIEHSGSIPNSGSVRSSSSNTSACSFAFPVLASEWSGSPVKMVNTDKKQWPPTPIAKRKQLKRPPRWRLLVCCKSITEE
ncbi:conserved hypothetical protein [Ricinus communis]|uniref:Uncharacterized protein n=2 Tax=Ricinus communis TaxID=3988 RepID=B9RLI5_RICCO|nr:conserved hypothetical protein [Ricinus communis]